MTNDALLAPIREKYDMLRQIIWGDDLPAILDLALEVHALVHPAAVSGRDEKTIADYVLDYMMDGNQNVLIPREIWDTDLHYAGTKTVPLCWQL